MRTITLTILIFLVSCGQELTSPMPRSSQGREYNPVTCSCSETVNPVCGYNGTHYITFINGCIAQCNDFDYTSGACQVNANTNCNQDSGQVCGLPPCTNNVNCSGPIIYNNECALKDAGASPLEMSQCTSLL